MRAVIKPVNIVEFSSLRAGDVFVLFDDSSDNRFWLKTMINDEINAVNLYDGDPIFVPDGMQVIKVDAVLMVDPTTYYDTK